MSTSEITFLEELEAIIKSRINSASDSSYTAQLASTGIKRIAQKVGEEGVELALAAVAGDSNETIDEAADLIYHMLVLLAVKDIDLSDVTDRLQQRHTQSK